MSKKRSGNRKKFKKEKPEIDSLFGSDEYFGFIAGYTSNGVPYGLTHEEMEEIMKETMENNIDKENIDLPF